jgi:hypothetical protein
LSHLSYFVLDGWFLWYLDVTCGKICNETIYSWI